MSSRPDLRMDWCTHEAAQYACEKWHYTAATPVGKLVRIGAWESGRFVGVVLFGWGMNRNLGSPYGLQMTECCELVRVAMADHVTPISRMVSLSIKLLKRSNAGLRAIVSFADPEAGHHGGIYQAGNWIYLGLSSSSFEWRLNGKRLNKRAYTGHNFGCARKAVPVGAEKVAIVGKHRYLMPLDDEMRHRVACLAKPYPKRVRSVDSDTAGLQPEEGGANPTRTL